MVDIPPKQALLLGAYLAYKEDWASRDELLHLFWPDEPEKVARHNLSQLLYHCKKQVWMEGLEVERNRVRWLVDTDVKRFQEALGSGVWHKATEHYSGKLLDSVSTDYAPSFEDWLLGERETLQKAWREAVLNHAGQLEEESKYVDAAGLALSALKQDPLAEDSLQLYMRCASKEGQRDQALRAFDEFSKKLADELDMQPLDATVALANKIRSSTDLEPSTSDANNITQTKSEKPRFINTPQTLTPFVGREPELLELSQLLNNPDVKLITLLGPGGIGKSRLATELAKLNAQPFEEVIFIELTPLTKPELIETTLLQLLGLSPSPEQTIEESLFAYASDKAMLFVFDNFEHLLDGAGLVLQLLEHSPQSKALVSSRELLDFQSEYIYEVTGLSYPKATDEASLEAFDAISFFVRSARRANPQFSLQEENKAHVIELCQLLEGIPLAIELATTWLRMLSPKDIIEEIRSGLEVLKVSHKDIPERHRSMQAVFEHTWSLLSDQEQMALKGLSVFRGGFTKDAATAVANATLRILLSLSNKSVLKRTVDGRFERHSLVQQFSLGKLAENPIELNQAKEEHATYFASFVETAKSHFQTREQAAWLNLVALDHDNVRTALSYFIAQEYTESAMQMCINLFTFWWLHGHYGEGRSILTEVLELNDEKTLLRAKVLNTAGSLTRLCEDFKEARALYEKSLTLKRELADDEAIANVLGNLGMLSRIEGDYATARQNLEECRAIFEKSGDKPRLANTLNNLAAIAESEGNRDEAWDLNEQSLKLANEVGERFIAARCLGNLGSYAYEKGDYDHAQTLRKESLKVFEELEYKVGIAVSYQGLGDVALGKKALEEARGYYIKSISVFNDLDDKRGIAEVLASLADLAEANANYERALICAVASLHLHECLGIATMPDSRASLENVIAKAKQVLEDTLWQHCYIKAEQFSWDEAFQYALEEPTKTLSSIHHS